MISSSKPNSLRPYVLRGYLIIMGDFIGSELCSHFKPFLSGKSIHWSYFYDKMLSTAQTDSAVGYVYREILWHPQKALFQPGKVLLFVVRSLCVFVNCTKYLITICFLAGRVNLYGKSLPSCLHDQYVLCCRCHMPSVTYLRLDGSVPAGSRHSIVNRWAVLSCYILSCCSKFWWVSETSYCVDQVMDHLV